jgi:hypothetical protein
VEYANYFIYIKYFFERHGKKTEREERDIALTCTSILAGMAVPKPTAPTYSMSLVPPLVLGVGKIKWGGKE